MPAQSMNRFVCWGLPVCLVFVATLWVTGCGAPTKTGTPGQPATSTPATAISPEMIQKVNDLVRLNKEYCDLAGTIQTFDDFKKNADALSGLDEQLSSLAEDLMIAEAKLSASQKTEFNSKYYDNLAKPSIEEKRQQKARIQSLIP